MPGHDEFANQLEAKATGNNTVKDPGDTNSIKPSLDDGLCRLDLTSSAETRGLDDPLVPGQSFEIQVRTAGGGTVTITPTSPFDEEGSTTFTMSSLGSYIRFTGDEDVNRTVDGTASPPSSGITRRGLAWRVVGYDGVAGVSRTGSISAPNLVLDSTNEMNLQIGGVGLFALDDAAIASNAGATDTAGQDAYVETQDAGGTATTAKTGGLLNFKTGDGSASGGNFAGGAGGSASVITGAGGANTGAATGQAGGAGGALAITSGAGGATDDQGADNGGIGGAIAVTSGAGGNSTGAGTTTDGGAGGAVSLVSGAGGTSAANAGGAGGAVAITGSVGGATADAGSANGGAGGGVTVTTGTGGLSSAGTGDGGAGGALVILAGDGAATNGGTDGAGGAVTVTAGAGGGSTDGVGGSVTLTPGAGTGTGVAGTVVVANGYGMTLSTNVVLFHAETTLTVAEIVGTSAGDIGHAAGATLVAAPGAGYALEFVSAVLIYDHATATYPGGGDDNVIQNGDTATALSTVIAGADLLEASGDKMVTINALAATDQVLVANKPLSFKGTALTDPGTAVGVLRCHVAYKRHTTGL
jgi:hypothetical protein